MTNTRSWDLDWLRVIAFGILIYFHAAVAFLPQGIPMILNEQSSVVMQYLVSFLHEFRLGLLFFVSGVGTAFALRSRDRRGYFAERTRRLLVPLVFGVLVVVPPMVYLEKLYIGEIFDDFWQFYPSLFDGSIYPHGALSWHHYWFIAYLYLYCVLSWPVFRYFIGSVGTERLLGWSTFACRGAGIYLLVLPLLVFEIPLRPLFPGFRDLIHDWASFANWWLVFIFGFAFARNTALLDRAMHLRLYSLVIASATTFVLFGQFSKAGASFSPLHDGSTDAFEYLWFSAVRMTNAWCWILVCVGFARRYLNRSSAALSYLNRAVYPLFCLHLTVLVAWEFVVLPTDASVAVKYLVITTGTVGVCLVGYEGIRRVGWLRPLFGMRGR